MKIRSLPSVLLALSAVALVRADDSVALRTLKGEVPAGVRTIDVSNDLGNVTVSAVAANFGWEWNLSTSGAQTGRTAAYVQDCKLEVTDDNGVLRLVVVRPERQAARHSSGVWRHVLSAVTLGTVPSPEEAVRSDLVLRVPAASAVAIKDRFGSVRVTGVRGAVDVDNRNGRIDLTDLPGAVSARTSFGSVHAERTGPADIASQNGNLELRSVDGDLRAATSFGRLTVADVKGMARLDNQNGMIDAARITGEVRARTSFGGVQLDEIGGRAEVRNQNGRITATRVTGDLVAETSFADLRADGVGGKAVLKAQNGKIDAARITGDLRASTSFASLNARDVGGAADLTGQNCAITAAGMSGDLRAETSFGSIKLEGDGRHFDARNQNGAVQIVALSPAVERIDASATFGSIDVRLPADTKPVISARTSFGKVHSDFPLTFGETAAADAGAAPLKVSLRGQNGDIRVNRLAVR